MTEKVLMTEKKKFWLVAFHGEKKVTKTALQTKTGKRRMLKMYLCIRMFVCNCNEWSLECNLESLMLTNG